MEYNTPTDKEQSFLLLYYTSLLVVMMGALLICYLEESKHPEYSMIATLRPILFPTESVPWNNMQQLELLTGPFGLGFPRISNMLAPRRQTLSVYRSTFEIIPISLSTKLHGYCGYFVGFLRGIKQELIWSVKPLVHYNTRMVRERWNTVWWKEFYTRHIYTRIVDCFNRPVSSAPTAKIDVCARSRAAKDDEYSPLVITGRSIHCINLASYNYLGYGGVDPDCTPACVNAVKDFGIAMGGTRNEVEGTCDVHTQLEAEIAAFAGKEAAIVVGMGFATNSTLIPAVIDGKGNGRGVLVVSDELNHRSIVEGVRLSGASVKSFKHNDIGDLEHILKEATLSGKWRKIWIIVEGIYSMEGGFCRLRQVVALKEKYRAYLWLDEAHSIGAVGPTGRGVTELLSVPTACIDVMMGTFTKSFGSAGGYIAADASLINQVKRQSTGHSFATSMAPLCAAQALAALRVLKTKRGLKKIQQVTDNSNYFRKELVKLGLRVVGDADSPIVCAMLVHPEKIRGFSRECLKRNLAVVVVGFPATPVLLARARFCVSAAHTQKDLDTAIRHIGEVADIIGIRFAEADALDDVLEAKQRLLSAPLSLGKAIDYWTPEPLVYTELAGPIVYLPKHRGSINATGHDPLGLRSNPPVEITEAVIERLKNFGCGTCGPRGFYGTTTDHLYLEKSIAEFMGTESAIVYSMHVATASSVVSAFVNKEDTIYVQYGVNVSLLNGIRLTRSRDIKVFKTTADLSSLLSKRKVKPSPNYRTWIICEGGLSSDVDISEVVNLKMRSGAYLILDDSLCIGATGRTGRGSVEHFGIAVTDIDAIVGSLEHSFGSMGGFCCGRKDVTDHQTLYGSGYCFSASAPACLAVASYKAIDFLKSPTGHARLEALQDNIATFVTGAKSKTGLKLLSSSESYCQVVQLPEGSTADDVYTKLRHTQTQPLRLAPLRAVINETFELCMSTERLLRINFTCEMSRDDVLTILEDLSNNAI